MDSIVLDQTLLYPERRQFDLVYLTEEQMVATLALKEEHCCGHFLHKPMLPLSEVGSMASRAAALHCQALANQDKEFWALNPLAVVAKYTPGELTYKDPFVENCITISVCSKVEKFSKRICRVQVHFYADSDMGNHVHQSFEFTMAFRKDLGPWT